MAPSQRLKYEQYFSTWRKAGYSIEVSPFFAPEVYRILYRPGSLWAKIKGTLAGYLRRLQDLWRIRRYDVVYIHLWVTPLGPPLFEFLVSRLCSRLVYDLDDMISLAPASPANWLVARLKGRGKMPFLIQAASQVIVCTPALEELTRRYHGRVVDISSTIDTDAYQPVNRYSNSHRVVLGWTGSHSTSRYLRLLEPVLRRLQKLHDFRLVIMGDPSFSFSGIECESRPWSEEAEVSTLQSIDIGLYPLPLDDPWVMGKSGLKALQYMALGLPTVATAIGANFRVIDHGKTGFLVTTEQEWVDTLCSLIRDAELRQRVGQAARHEVEERFSLKANADRYLKVLARVRETEEHS